MKRAIQYLLFGIQKPDRKLPDAAPQGVKRVCVSHAAHPVEQIRFNVQL